MHRQRTNEMHHKLSSLECEYPPGASSLGVMCGSHPGGEDRWSYCIKGCCHLSCPSLGPQRAKLILWGACKRQQYLAAGQRPSRASLQATLNQQCRTGGPALVNTRFGCIRRVLRCLRRVRSHWSVDAPLPVGGPHWAAHTVVCGSHPACADRWSYCLKGHQSFL